MPYRIHDPLMYSQHGTNELAVTAHSTLHVDELFHILTPEPPSETLMHDRGASTYVVLLDKLNAPVDSAEPSGSHGVPSRNYSICR